MYKIKLRIFIMNLALPPTILMKNTCGLETYGYLKPKAEHIWIHKNTYLYTYIYSYILMSYTCIKAAVEQKSELKAICIF